MAGTVNRTSEFDANPAGDSVRHRPNENSLPFLDGIFAIHDCDRLIKEGMLDQAMSVINALLEKQPHNPAALWRKGKILDAKGDFDSAIIYYDTAVDGFLKGARGSMGTSWFYLAAKVDVEKAKMMIGTSHMDDTKRVLDEAMSFLASAHGNEFVAEDAKDLESTICAVEGCLAESETGGASNMQSGYVTTSPDLFGNESSATTESEFTHGMQAFNIGDYEKAIASFKDVAGRAKPGVDAGRAYALMGFSSARSNKSDDASSYFKKAREHYCGLLGDFPMRSHAVSALIYIMQAGSSTPDEEIIRFFAKP